MKIIFDLDGTLREISHRRHLVKGKNPDWEGPNGFFLSCDKDEPVWPVIDVMFAFIDGGHDVQIWSGASAISFDMTVDWFKRHTGRDVSEILTHMRPAEGKDKYTPDDILKLMWLEAEDTPPDMIFDDRQKVVDMWRKNGVVCAQIAPGDFDTPKVDRPRNPTLRLYIGPSGAGKTAHMNHMAADYHIPDGDIFPHVISTDSIRKQQYPSDTTWCDPVAYTPEGFVNTHGTARAIAKSMLDGGLDVIYDATNLRRKDRVTILEHVGALEGGIDVEYIIIDRNLDEKIADFHNQTASAQPGRTSEAIIRKHHDTFQSSKKFALNGDGFDFVKVTDLRSNA